MTEENKQDLLSAYNMHIKANKMSTLIRSVLVDLENCKNNKKGSLGLLSGFAGVDELTAGWQNGELIVVAAREGMGKLAFALTLARNTAINNNIPVAIFSLAQSAKQITRLLISAETGKSLNNLRHPKDIAELEWAQMLNNLEPLYAAPLFVYDLPSITITDLVTKCQWLYAHYNIRLFIIDSLELIKGSVDFSPENARIELINVYKNLRDTAQLLNVPIIITSHLGMEPDYSSDRNKRPIPGDLKEYEYIEEYIGAALFIYRAAYYGLKPDNLDNLATNCDIKEIAEIDVVKNRNGAKGRVYLRYNAGLAKFEEIEHNKITE